MTLIATVITAWLGSMFIYSAGLKFARYDSVGSLVKLYRILPAYVDSALGFVLPWVELLTGALLLFGWLFPSGPLLGVTLGGSFAYASARVLRRGADVPCGSTGQTTDRVNRITLIRAAVISASSLLLVSIASPESAALPRMAVGPIILISLLPASVIIYRRIVAAQRRQIQERHLQDEFVRARSILSASPVSTAQDR